MADILKAEKTLSFFKTYVLPAIVFICGLSVAWAILDNSVSDNAYAISNLESRCSENEKTVNIVLQRLASIDTKLEYIIKEVDSLNSN